jgi:glycerophosphoryl diester phosphodiesterase
LQFVTDVFFAIIPRKCPGLYALQNCRIVSHRGEFDNKKVMENTLPAFDAAIDSGVWGIELDIRWTRDLVPVVIHDANCQRVFGISIEVANRNLERLQKDCPNIPTLEQVISRYGKKVHLMIEIKQEKFRDLSHQRETLKNLLKDLTPANDFHLLALNPALFDLFDIIPSSAMLPVAELNFRALSREAVEKGYAGVCGQYLLISNQIVKTHARHQQKVGTGFARSRFAFYRELNRNVEWIFTNHAIKLNNIRKSLLNDNPPQ